MLNKVDMEYLTKELEKNYNNKEEWWKLIEHYKEADEWKEEDKC